MHGFISESVSKLSDGLGNAIKLILLALFLKFLNGIIDQSVIKLDNFLFIVMLVFANLLYLYRCFDQRKSQDQRVMNGMIAGLLFWQVMININPEISSHLTGASGLIYWSGTLILTMLLWKKVLPVGLRFTFILFLANWLGWICVHIFGSLEQVKPALKFIPYLASSGIILSIWFIILRSANIIQRQYGATALYFFVLLTLMRF